MWTNIRHFGCVKYILYLGDKCELYVLFRWLMEVEFVDPHLYGPIFKNFGCVEKWEFILNGIKFEIVMLLILWYMENDNCPYEYGSTNESRMSSSISHNYHSAVISKV